MKVIGGVSHVGVGVSNMESSLLFYRDALGYKMIGEYEGAAPELGSVRGEKEVRARIVLVKSEDVSPLGLGLVMLVQILPPFHADPLFPNYSWGDIGIAEAAISVSDVDKTYEKLVLQGFKAVLPPVSAVLDGEEVRLCYVKDPDGSYIELIDWKMFKRAGVGESIEGVNHVAFGVADFEKSVGFYKDKLGFKDTIFSFEGYLPMMAPMFSDQLTRMRLILLTNEYRDAWIEIAQHINPKLPRSRPTRWGQIGPMEFGIKVSNIEMVYNELTEGGVLFKSPLHKMKFGAHFEWKYAYISEPDNLCVSIVEY